MNMNLFNTNKVEDEISFREIFISLWKRKIMIICFFVIAGLVAGMFSKLAIAPVYYSKLNIIINIPDIYTTKYGDYTLPISANQQYLNLITSNKILVNTIKDMGFDTNNVTIENLKSRITISPVTTIANVEQNSFEVKTAADNPKEAQQLAQVLYDNYIEFLDVLTADGAVNYYYNDYSVELRSLEVSLETEKVILRKNEELLAQTPQTINQKEAFDEIQGQDNLKDFIIMENIINTNYTEIEKTIILNKQSINSMESTMSLNKTYLEELDEIRETIKNYYVTGNFDELKASIVRVTEANVQLPSAPAIPSEKSSPSNTKNAIIGAFLGGMLGVLIALMKEYWLKKILDIKE